MILSGDVEETEEMDKILRQVNMVIVPVTSKLLKSENRAMESEIPYAIRNHIPVLPIVVEKIPDFPSLYNEKFQHIQYLNKISRETIGIPYIQKLRKTLEVYTLGLDQEKKIRDAFDLHVFLSYRKKDKFYAEELLFLIHQNQASKDIAVWYDEFLNPGKKWNDGIMDAIDQCDVYSLIVTPSIVEDGNFVQQKEYPRARQKEKVIKPIIFEEIDMDDSDFEKLYFVKTDNRFLTMQIFTSSLLRYIVDFKTKYKIIPEITIKKEKIYLRFSINTTLFEPHALKSPLSYSEVQRQYIFINSIMQICKDLIKNINEIEL